MKLQKPSFEGKKIKPIQKKKMVEANSQLEKKVKTESKCVE